jgi:hypothetical protein
MFYQLKTNNGDTEAVIDDNCGISKFYAIANTLEDELKVSFIQQTDDAETINWHFKYKDEVLVLHYNIFNGVSIYPQLNKKKSKENNNVVELAKFLGQKIY